MTAGSSSWLRWSAVLGALAVGAAVVYVAAPATRGAAARAAGTSAAEMAGLPRRAEAAITAGDWAGAAAALQEVVRLEPRNAGACRDLIDALERVGKDTEAAAFLAARPWLYGDSAAGRGSDAGPATLEIASATVRRRPRDAAAHAVLAEALIVRARAQTAALSSRCSICHHREPPLYGRALTRVLFPDRATLVQALAARQAAARLRPSPADTRRAGEIYVYLATLFPPRHREAREYLARARRALERAVQAAPRDVGAWSSLAFARRKQGDVRGAEAAWRRALALDAEHEEARVNLASALEGRGRLAEAVALYAEGIRRVPNSAALRTNYGVLLWQSGLYREAVAAQREALRLRPGDPVALLNLGLALKAAGDPARAEAALRESIRRRPSGAVAHNALGSLLAQRGDWESAAHSFAEAARRNPGLAAAHANFGRACEQLGRWPEAAAAFEQAVLWDPARSTLWARAAEAWARAGEYPRAAAAAGRFLARHPQDSGADLLRARLAEWQHARS